MTRAFLTSHVAMAIYAVFAVLAVATVLVGLLAGRGRTDASGAGSKSASELVARVKSWWWMTIIFAAAIMTYQWAATILLAFVSFLALKEYLSLIPQRRTDRSILLWAYIAIPIQYWLASLGRFGLFMTFIPVWLFLFIPARMTIGGETENFLRAVGTVSWGAMICVFCLSHTALLLAVGMQRPEGAGPLLLLIILTEFNDVAQFTWGKLLGRHKIMPTVSPNKTWQGFVGGLLSTTALAAFAGPYLTPMPMAWSAAAGFFIASTGFLGDVTISAFKRDLGVKDTSQLIPGHGGILDRVDSLIYAAPAFFHFYNFFFLSGRVPT